MKKIKKLFLVVALFLFASTAMPVITRVAKVASAAPEANFEYLTVEKFVDEANVGSDYYITDAKVWENNNGTVTEKTGVNATVKVLNPLGQEVTDETIASDNYFKVNYVGDYSIIYTYGGFSHTLKVSAEQGVYSFDFAKNAEQIIPTFVNIENYTGKIVLPNPTVLDEQGNKIENADVEVKVLPPSSSEYLNGEQLVKNSDGYYEFTANVVGNWTVNYVYKSADGRVLASTTKSFTANETYNNDYKLVIVNNSSSKPTTAVTGVTTVLPTITGKNAVTEDAVDIYYSIKAKRVEYNSTTGEIVSEKDVTADCIANVNEFTPNQDGDYIITYTAKNFFGKTANWEYEISGVKDTRKPEVKVVKPYTTKPADGYADASYFLPEKAGTKNIVLPAIWAEDNVDKTLEGLTLTRKITRSNNEVVFESAENPNKEVILNYDATSYTIDLDTQFAGSLKEGEALRVGTYTVSYIAKDSAGNETTALTYKLVLQEGFSDDEKPTVEWSETEAIPSTTRVGDQIRFVKPVTSDNVSTRIQLSVVYQFGTSIDETAWVECEYENGEYVIDVVEADKLFIRAVATDGYDNVSEQLNKEIEIHDTNDTKATTIASTEEVAGNVYKQQNEITLRNVNYVDDYADYVQVGAYVTVEKDGKDITRTAYDLKNDINYDANGDLDVIAVTGAKIWASYSGTYKVAYVSKDLKNNYTIMFYSFDIAPYTDDAEIALTKLPSTLNGGKLELGETIKMPTAEVSVPEGYTYTYSVSLVSGPANENTVLNKYEFKPAVAGTYVIEYSAKVKDSTSALIAEQPETVKFTVEVKDETDPVIGEIYVEPVVALNYKLEIPQFTASDLSGIDTENSKVTLSSKSYGTKTLYYGDTTSKRDVILGYNEVYTLKFYVYDMAGNETIVTKEIKVGDTDAPVITINEDDKVFVPETITDGKLSIDLSQITVSDLIDTEISKEDLVITVTRDGEKINNIHGDSKTQYEYDVKKAGSYVVTLEIKDAAGNVSEKITRKFTVSADENNGVDKEQVIGIVLIVVSVLILAGVVVYFIVSHKKKGNKYNEK